MPLCPVRKYCFLSYPTALMGTNPHSYSLPGETHALMDGQSSSWPCSHHVVTPLHWGWKVLLCPLHNAHSNWTSCLPCEGITTCSLHFIHNCNNDLKKKKVSWWTEQLHWDAGHLEWGVIHLNLSAINSGQTGLLTGQMVGTTVSAFKRPEVTAAYLQPDLVAACPETFW